MFDIFSFVLFFGLRCGNSGLSNNLNFPIGFLDVRRVSLCMVAFDVFVGSGIVSFDWLGTTNLLYLKALRF